MFTVVYDLDGVLIDSKNLITSSYRKAGVEPPADILAREGDSWMPNDVDKRAVRQKKGHYYLRGITRVPLLPLYSYAVALARAKSPIMQNVLSGAPLGTLCKLRNAADEWPFDICIDSMKTPSKMQVMARWAIRFGPGVYIDDQPRFIDMPPGWLFIHYVGQSIDEIGRRVYEWSEETVKEKAG